MNAWIREYIGNPVFIIVILFAFAIKNQLKPKARLIISSILFTLLLFTFIISSTSTIQFIVFSIVAVAYIVLFYYRYKKLSNV